MLWSWVLKRSHRVQEVPGVMRPHWFSRETLMSQAEGKVPFKPEDFAASVPVLQLGLFGEATVLYYGASSQGPLSLTVCSPQSIDPFPPFFILETFFIPLPS